MDGSAKELVLDERGVCNFCHEMQASLRDIRKGYWEYKDTIEHIQKDGIGKQYDCLIGLSGGVDSSMVLHHAVRLGLRPLCFSVDNGWNDPKADENIMRLIETLKVPFYRYVIDLDKFKSLQAAFFKAGVINIEIPTDHVLMAATYEMAAKNGIKWILSGGNVNTEGIMPASWSHPARDLTHIKAIYKWATGKKLSGLPLCGLFMWNVYRWWYGLKTFYLLDYEDYNRAESIKLLEEKYGWKDYGEKHGESVFTRWFQSFYLFEKFGIDKRKAHYSSLINAGQMTRDEALFALEANPVYPRLGIEERIMGYQKHDHSYFASDEKWRALIGSVVKKLSWK